MTPGELADIRSDGVPDEAGERPLGWGQILGYREAWSFIVAKLLTDPVWWFFLTWLPDYFKKKWALDIKKSWVHLVTIYAIITVLSIVGGWLTAYLARRGWSNTRSRKTGMFIFACCVLPIFFTTVVGPWTAVLLIGIAGAAHQAWSANLFTTTSDMFPKRAVASLVGVGGMAGSLGGMAFPLVAGVLLDRMGTSGSPFFSLFAGRPTWWRSSSTTCSRRTLSRSTPVGTLSPTRAAVCRHTRPRFRLLPLRRCCASGPA